MPKSKETTIEVRVKVGPKNDPLSMSISMPIPKSEAQDIGVRVFQHVHDAFRKAMDREDFLLLDQQPTEKPTE